jgi:hypothetical protein
MYGLTAKRFLTIAIVAAGLAAAPADAQNLVRDGRPQPHFVQQRGALVTWVAQYSGAARAGLERGDVILDVNGLAIQSLADLRHALGRDRDGHVLLKVRNVRDGRTVRVHAHLRHGRLGIGADIVALRHHDGHGPYRHGRYDGNRHDGSMASPRAEF